jgi:hypothetical protein
MKSRRVGGISKGLLAKSRLHLLTRSLPIFNECKRLWVLKKAGIGRAMGAVQVACSEEKFPASQLSRCRERWLRPLAEEADQALDVLRSRSQEELLANKL